MLSQYINAQTVILISSVLALALVTRVGRPKVIWSGHLIGLLGQPAWLYVTFAAEQWGMFAVSVVYTMIWLEGVCKGWAPSSMK